MTSDNKDKDSFFVVLKNPVEFRRNLLESLKLQIQAMQRYERFKDLRQGKTELLDQTRNIIKDINYLTNRLKTKLPKLTLPKSEIDKYKKKHEEEEKAGVAPPVPEGEAQKSEVQILEDQLSNIESELSDLK